MLVSSYSFSYWGS